MKHLQFRINKRTWVEIDRKKCSIVANKCHVCVKCDFGYINYCDMLSPVSLGYLLASPLSKVIEHKFIYYENTYAAIFFFFHVQSIVQTLPDEMENIYGFLFSLVVTRCKHDGEKICETKSKAIIINCSSTNASSTN